MVFNQVLLVFAILFANQQFQFLFFIFFVGIVDFFITFANKSNNKIEYAIHLPIENEWDNLYLDEKFFK